MEWLDSLITFYGQYGWQMALIALAGIVILGVLKYLKVFDKIDKEKRKPIYLAISVGLSAIGAAIYLLCIQQFQIDYFVTMLLTLYTINQAMYAVYETTTLKQLVAKIVEWIKEKLLAKKESAEVEDKKGE